MKVIVLLAGLLITSAVLHAEDNTLCAGISLTGTQKNVQIPFSAGKAEITKLVQSVGLLFVRNKEVKEPLFQAIDTTGGARKVRMSFMFKGSIKSISTDTAFGDKRAAQEYASTQISLYVLAAGQKGEIEKNDKGFRYELPAFTCGKSSVRYTFKTDYYEHESLVSVIIVIL